MGHRVDIHFSWPFKRFPRELSNHKNEGCSVWSPKAPPPRLWVLGKPQFPKMEGRQALALEFSTSLEKDPKPQDRELSRSFLCCRDELPKPGTPTDSQFMS